MSNIILIGFMGSGKTTIGKIYAKQTNKYFVDTDEYIEVKYNQLIKDIFADKGEAYFRDLETETLKELLIKDNAIISVGGGLPVRNINREYLKKMGKIIYLRASVDTLCSRLASDTTRPLLDGVKIEDRIVELMSQRKEIYEGLADFIIDTDRLSIEDTVERVMKYENTSY